MPEDPLRPVLVTCPVTKWLVPTGLRFSEWGDIYGLPDENLLAACPECGSDHAWRREDAALGTTP